METQRCMGCMQLKGTAVVCPKCGFHADQECNPVVLPYKTALNNKFLVGRMLGKPGGFGITYLAWDSILHTTVAIKEYLPRELATRSPNGIGVMLYNPKDKERFIFGLHQFLQEARTLAQFSHPNVVRAREFFQQNNTAYLVMDYYEGVSLEEFVHKKGGKISEQFAFNIMLPILDGLREVHQKGFLHRDIKPANIYLTKGDLPILLDFGAARFAVSQKVDRPSMIITEGFAPFEQYLEDADGALGPWTDIYAYGATLYAITTGVIPMSAINRYRKDELLSPIQLVPTLTPQLSRAIMAALTLDHEQRPQNVQALQTLLLSRDRIQIAPLVPSPSNFIATESLSYRAAPIRESSFASPPLEEDALPRSALNVYAVRCPYCRTRNTLAQGQDVNKLHCYQCGKRVSPSAVEKKFSYIIWGLVVIAITLAGLLALKVTRDMMVSDAAITGISDVIYSPHDAVDSKTENPVDAVAEELLNNPEPPPNESPVEVKAESTESEAVTPAPEEASANNTPIVTLNAEEPVAVEPKKPPEFAVIACKDKHEGEYCEANNGSIRGTCYNIMQQLACIPTKRGI